jgi:hypothetical protein
VIFSYKGYAAFFVKCYLIPEKLITLVLLTFLGFLLMNISKVFSTLFALSFALMPGISQSQETILAYSPGESQTVIRGYSKVGSTLFELKIDNKDFKSAIAGRWSQSSTLGLITGEAKEGKIRLYNNNGSIAKEISMPNEPVNTIFAADLNNNGYSDLVFIVQTSGKTKAVVFYDPGISSSPETSLTLPTQAMYFAPAIAGTSTVGILAYNPASPKSSAARIFKANSKKKQKKVKKSANGVVQLFDSTGNLVKSFSLKKPADGQIYPFSPDGQCGFAIQNAQKLKAYFSDGTPSKEINLNNENPAVLGNFSDSSNLEEVLIPQSVGLGLLNISSGASSDIALTGLPNQQELLDQEISRITELLVQAYDNEAPLDEIWDYREQLLELSNSRSQITSAANVAGRLARLFTGGAGSIEGVCDKVDETPNDGYGGFLIKNGDYSGKIVILTPGGKDYFNAELLKMGTYKPFQKLSDSGFGNPDSNGARKHFRGNGTIQSLGKFVFRAQIKEGYSDDTVKKHCWFITKSASRID